MGKAIGIRLPKEVLQKIEQISKDEVEDRSTVIRKLVLIGYKDLIQKKMAEEYLNGKITLSEAAYKVSLTIFEMERYLVEHGFKSAYSIDDLKREIKILGK